MTSEPGFILAPVISTHRFAPIVKNPSSLLALACLSGMTATHGALIASHTGLNDPSTEGFVLSDSSAVAGPVSGDMGLDAWSVDSTGGYYNHRFTVGAAEVTDANSNGWLLSMTLRLVDAPDAMDFGVSADYVSSGGIFRIGFGTQADGDPIVGLDTDSGVTLFEFEGGGTGYHNYQIHYDPTTGSATLSIDGTVRLSGWTGRTGPAPSLLNFGSYGPGHANWNEFTFSSVPEPGAAVLAGIACGLGAMRRRRSAC